MRFEDGMFFGFVLSVIAGILLLLAGWSGYKIGHDPYTPCPAEDMVRIAVAYPEGPDVCVHIDAVTR